MRRRSSASAVLAIIAIAAACSSSGPSSRSAASSGAAIGPSTTAPPSTTTSVAPASCATGPAEAPAKTVRQTHGQADVDGNGTDDTVSVYGTGTAAAPGPWYVAVDVGGVIGRRQVAIADADPDDANQQIRYLGVAEAGGSPVVFASVGSGASATIVGLFELVGCDLVRVQTPAQSMVTFAVGGTVTHLSGLRCRGTDLEVLQALSNDGTAYTGSTTAVVVANGTLTTQPPTTVPSIPSDAVPAYGGLDCPGVEQL